MRPRSLAPPRRLLKLSSLALLVTLTGCQGLRTEWVQLEGTLHEILPPGPAKLPGLSYAQDRLYRSSLEAPKPEALTFTSHGRPQIFGRPVGLPLAQEDLRYGVVVVDLTPLAAAWRPASAREGGLVVSALDRGSPLALAGLRCGDRILRVNGQEVATPRAVARALAEAEAVRLEVRSVATGQDRTLSAEASAGIRDLSHWSAPGLVTWISSPTGAGFKLGPLGFVFNLRSAWVTDDRRYLLRNEWGCLFDLIAWESETDPQTGESRARLRLFWFLPLGDA